MFMQIKWISVSMQKIGFNLWHFHKYSLTKYWMFWGRLGSITQKEKAWFLFIKRSAGF